MATGIMGTDRFALPNGLKLGDYVLVSAPGSLRGLGRLKEFVEVGGKTLLKVEFPEQFISLLIEPSGTGVLEPPMPSARAGELLLAFDARTVQPDERPSDDQLVTAVKTVSRGSWGDVQQRLAVLYASPWKPSFGESRTIEQFERALIPILAHALGRDYAALVTEIRRGKPVFSATEPRPPAPPRPEPPRSPALAGYESLFPFEIGDTLLIGERLDWHDRPDHGGLATVRVTAGFWYAYERHAVGDEDTIVEFLLIHSSRLEERARAIASAQWKEGAP
jgi:hypothetical protein